jgi:hypothetical protein
MAEFKAFEVNFEGIPGYMVYQFVNGKCRSKGFTSKDDYKIFCSAIGTEPRIVDKAELISANR